MKNRFTWGSRTFNTYVKHWYDGSFLQVIFDSRKSSEVKEKVASILAGYAWDETNPFVTQAEQKLGTLIQLCS